jgi:hypothetical protein
MEASKQMNSEQEATGDLAGNSNRIEGVQGQNERAGVGGGEADKLYNKFLKRAILC